MSVGTRAVVCLVIGLETGEILFADMTWGLGPGLDTGVGVQMDADDVVNIFSSYCLGIFS